MTEAQFTRRCRRFIDYLHQRFGRRLLGYEFIVVRNKLTAEVERIYFRAGPGKRVSMVDGSRATASRSMAPERWDLLVSAYRHPIHIRLRGAELGMRILGFNDPQVSAVLDYLHMIQRPWATARFWAA